MWYHKFDPHSVPDIPLAELKPKPNISMIGKKGETVKEFLDRSNLNQKSVIY